MAHVLLRVPVHDGSGEFIEVEVDRGELSEMVQLTSVGESATTAAFSLASSVDRILPAISTVVTRLRTADYAPQEIKIELGLKVGGETGLVFAKGTAEATFAVSVTWRRPTGEDSTGDGGWAATP